MISDRHEEQAALHALGLLDGAERSAFEAELAGSRELQSLVDSLTTAGASLAAAATPARPSAALKARVLDAIAADAPSADDVKVVRFPLGRYAPWAAAAVLAVTSAWLATRGLVEGRGGVPAFGEGDRRGGDGGPGVLGGPERLAAEPRDLRRRLAAGMGELDARRRAMTHLFIIGNVEVHASYRALT